MKTINKRNKLSNCPTVDCTAISVVYKSKSGLYRGFVQPYDITFEDTTKDKVLSALREMIEIYEDGIRTYNHSSNLIDVPLSDDEDREKWNAISPNLSQRLFKKEFKITTPFYYAEAKLPS